MTIPRHAAPPAPSGRPHLPLVRLPAKAIWDLAITCFEALQIDTHFLGRRTLPHLAENCPGCEYKKPLRYECYVTALRKSDKRHLIVALTANAANQLYAAVPNANQLRGHIVTLRRAGSRPNGMLQLEVAEHMVSTEHLPDAPSLLDHMLDIWGLDQSHLGQDHAGYAADVAENLTIHERKRGA